MAKSRTKKRIQPPRAKIVPRERRKRRVSAAAPAAFNAYSAAPAPAVELLRKRKSP